MQPVAKSSPLPCFGLERSEKSEQCQACPHFVECGAHMGMRVNRVNLASLAFDFMPPAMNVKVGDFLPEERDIQATFEACHLQVFGKPSGQSLAKWAKQVLSMSREARCSVRVFILANMVGYAAAYPENEFTPGLLGDYRAAHRVHVYGSACRKKYAAFEDLALDAVAKDNVAKYNLVRRMLASEAMAGHWIIEFKLHHAGSPFESFFEECEMELDPNWLAIDPRYDPTLEAHVADPGTMSVLRKRRHEVARSRIMLKRNKHLAIAHFRAREAAMPDALLNVLSRFGYAPEDFEMEAKPVTDSLHLWNRLGLAVQHAECLKYLKSELSVYGRKKQSFIPGSLR